MEASALHAAAGVGRARVGAGASFLRLRSDEQLVELFRAGHEEAFRVIHDRYRTRLLAYIRQMLPNSRQDAEDALQDVFIRAYAGLRANDRHLALRAWLYRVAHNRCVDQLRKHTPILTDEIEATSTDVFSDPHAAVLQREDLRKLVLDVQRLPEQQRSALLLRELSGMSYQELADSLELSIPAIKSLLVRARVGLAAAAEARDASCERIRAEIVESHERGARPTALTRRHLSDCAACREYRDSVRGLSKAYAALLPAAPALFALKWLGVGSVWSAASGGSAGGAVGTGVAAGSAAAAAGSAAAAAGGASAVGGAAAAAAGGAVAAGGVGAGHLAALIAAAAAATAGGAVAVTATAGQHHVSGPAHPAASLIRHAADAGAHGNFSPAVAVTPALPIPAGAGATATASPASGSSTTAAIRPRTRRSPASTASVASLAAAAALARAASSAAAITHPGATVTSTAPAATAGATGTTASGSAPTGTSTTAPSTTGSTPSASTGASTTPAATSTAPAGTTAASGTPTTASTGAAPTATAPATTTAPSAASHSGTSGSTSPTAGRSRGSGSGTRASNGSRAGGARARGVGHLHTSRSTTAAPAVAHPM